MLDDLVLQTLADNPDLDSTDIDDNWTRIAEFGAAVKLALTAWMNNIVSASTVGGLSFTMTDGTVIGPLTFSGIPVQPAGEWAIGVAYETGDIVTKDGGSGMVALPHVAVDYDDDASENRLVILAAPSGGGGGAVRPMYQRVEALGSVSNSGDKLIAQFVVPYDCCFSLTHPILGAITTPINSGGDPLEIKIKRVKPDGSWTILDYFFFNPTMPGAYLALDDNLDMGDGLQFIQTDGTASTGGANWTLTVPFCERA